MRETTRTTYSIIPIGWYDLTVEGRPEKRKAGKTSYRIWKFLGKLEGTTEPKKINVILFPWESESLLRALGAEEQIVDGVIEFNWDDEKVIGKSVRAQIIHGIDNNDKPIAKIGEAMDLSKPIKEKEVAWDEEERPKEEDDTL